MSDDGVHELGKTNRILTQSNSVFIMSRCLPKAVIVKEDKTGSMQAEFVLRSSGLRGQIVFEHILKIFAS